MLTNKKLIQKRAKREAKRKSRREMLKKIAAIDRKNRKARILRERAMSIITQNPSLLKKFTENQAKNEGNIPSEA